MIIKLFSEKYFLKKHILFLSIFTLQIISAQTAPANTRLFQLNTAKGSLVQLVEFSKNNSYHVGTANSEIGFDGYNTDIKGKDALFVLKSNSSDGTNIWLKTFNASAANGFISAKNTYVDANENVYIIASLSGSFTLGSKTIQSSETVNGFLLKIDSEGNAIYFTALLNYDFYSINATKMVADEQDLFLINNKNRLTRINNLTGEIIYSKTEIYAGDYRSIQLKNNVIYLAGYNSTGQTFTVATESIPSRRGYILKGDKDANFTASLQISNSSGQSADINDIAFDSDGQLLLAGFTINAANLISETGTVPYTYNPNPGYTGNKVYYYSAKIDANLEQVAYFRTSSALTNTAPADINKNTFSTKIIPYGNEGNVRLVARTTQFLQNTITGQDGALVSIPSYGGLFCEFLISYDSNGISNGGYRPAVFGIKIAANENRIALTNINFRLFRTDVVSSSNAQPIWNKEKTSTVAGSISNPFIGHLNSQKSESFVMTVIEGKGNFFGTNVLNEQFTRSRYIARLGIDGLPKWTARFHIDAGTSELNRSSDYAAVDLDDNFLFLANTSGSSSTFVDTSGQFADFQQPANFSSKVLIKVDKSGNLLWSKQLKGTQFTSSVASVSVDNIGNVFLMGRAQYGKVSIDGISVGVDDATSTFVIKLDKISGSVIYSKTYADLNSDSIHPVFDAENNFYLFAKSINRYEPFVFDAVTIPANYRGNSLMLKFSNAGEVIFGKNFYANNTEGISNFASDVQFDGSDFIMTGFLERSISGNFIGLELEDIPIEYPDGLRAQFIAKINTSGTVIWQKPIYNKIGYDDSPTMDLDENKNIYLFQFALDKIKYNGAEYSFDALEGNKIVQKFDTDAGLKYISTMDPLPSTFQYIDVINDDAYNVSSFSAKRSFLSYPISNNNSSSLFIATFGTLDKKYLTPEKNYLELNFLDIPNNPISADNQFSFDLINNVNWSAISDQPWLNLSFTSLMGKNPLNTINGTGDAKITLSADQNTTGITRSSNVMISGENVASKTIIVSQGATLGINNNALSIITLYPNPTSDFLNIKSAQKISKVEIYDMSGKLIKSGNLKDEKISVESLLKGNYLLKLYTENGVVTSKFIKN